MANNRKRREPTTKPSRTAAGAVTLDFDGQLITPEVFRKAVNAFIDLIREVSDEVAGSSPKVQWNISVAAGSRLLIARPVADAATRAHARKAVAAITSGVRRLERGTTAPPVYFTERAIRAARDLASLRDPGDKAVSYVRIRTNGKPAEITQKSVATASTLMGDQHEAYGCVEGRLQTVSERGSFHFVVFDDLFDTAVNCSGDQDVMKQALAAFGKRVAVLGMVQYDTTGRPASIRVHTVRPFPDEQALPPIKNLRGIFKRAE
jgi:hypothetical protein